MPVIEQWTGRQAHALRAALRMSNETFAERLGVAPRTIGKWRKRPSIVPSPSMQEALDTLLRQAPDDARVRFAVQLGLEPAQPVLDEAALGQLNAAVGELTRALARLRTAVPASASSDKMEETSTG